MTRFALGSHVAPPRFLLFLLVLAGGAALLVPGLGWGRGVMAAFDAAAAVFLAAVSPLLGQGEARLIRVRAAANDANRALLLALTGLMLLVILVAVHGELRGKNDVAALVLVIATLALAWIFSNTVYALHYAHLFYSAGAGGGDAGGLDFPGTAEPGYWDFVYFSFTLGMTFQTSDVGMTDGRMRRVATGQCLAAFVFNLGVLAFTINVLGGG